eukprot:GEMP01007100.1.p1 GENE.GEMP01007100.1~~GEMP01007100.1.p1  ORF type:complete len:312 (+),score=28.77 GEMP01007100.1:87-1022(+)
MVCESPTAWFHPRRLSGKGAGLISFFGRDSPSTDSITSMKISSDEENSPTQKKRYTRAFDIADVVERGCAREVATDFIVPLKKSSKLWRFTILRSSNRFEFKLYSNDGNFLMFAKTHMGKRTVDFYLYHPETELFDAEDPTFRMTFSAEKKSWLLRKTLCECCVYTNRNCDSQELVGIEHYQEPIGDGLFNIMRVHVPAICDNSVRGVCWCLQNDFPTLASLHAGKTHSKAIPLENRKPTWNNEASSLVLEFRGRSIIPSAKNFQLYMKSKSDDTICQFGKIGPQTFALDLKHPLSIVQAFALAISTMFWE